MSDSLVFDAESWQPRTVTVGSTTASGRTGYTTTNAYYYHSWDVWDNSSHITVCYGGGGSKPKPERKITIRRKLPHERRTFKKE